MTPPRNLTASLATLLLVLAFGTSAFFALRRPAAPTPAPTAPVTYASTAAPPEGPTLPVPEQTQAAAEADRQATAWAAEQAAIIARATTAPFPTADPVAIPAGQPSSATARRGGLTLQVRLPKSTYLSGETGWAEVTVSNDGPEILFVNGGDDLAWTIMLGAQGREPPPWPWAPISVPSVRIYQQSLAPGQSVTGTLVFHVVGPPPTYAFWTATRFSRASPANPDGPDNIWLRLEAGPIPLTVLEPATGQQLLADLKVDATGWSMHVTDLSGHVPAGPLTGLLEASAADSSAVSYSSYPLHDNAAGTWSESWTDNHFGTGHVVVRAWVGAPGYLTAIARQTFGSGDAKTLFDSYFQPGTQTFDTLQAAQAAVGIPLYRLDGAPVGASLDSIRVEDSASSGLSSDGRSVTTHQFYRLPSGAWLELDQLYYSPPYEMGNWGQARYDGEAQALTVSGQPAYLMQSLAWWTLDWKLGNDGFELRAPISAISAGGLLAVAASVHS